jgi:hypothetical protein
MFGDLYDGLSLAWAWSWPTTAAEVTAVDVELAPGSTQNWRLAVAYKFWVGTDGPYTGESFWKPAFFSYTRVIRARAKIRNHQMLAVHRAHTPSINKLDREDWRNI